MRQLPGKYRSAGAASNVAGEGVSYMIDFVRFVPVISQLRKG
jgi:hypothetical protein